MKYYVVSAWIIYIAAAEAVLPIWAVVVIGVAAPVVTLLGYFLQRRKVQEIHIMVNNRLDKIEAKNQALVKENTRLRGEMGEDEGSD